LPPVHRSAVFLLAGWQMHNIIATKKGLAREKSALDAILQCKLAFSAASYTGLRLTQRRKAAAG
jgi:hypothetical protein